MGARHLAEKCVLKINKMPEFYMLFARKIFFPIFFLGGGRRANAAPAPSPTPMHFQAINIITSLTGRIRLPRSHLLPRRFSLATSLLMHQQVTVAKPPSRRALHLSTRLTSGQPGRVTSDQKYSRCEWCFNSWNEYDQVR